MLDFDYLIISNQIFQAEQMKETLAFFSRMGIKKFIITYNVDLSYQSFRRSLAQIKKIQTTLSSVCPKGTSALVYPMLLLSKDAVKNPYLPSFAFGGSKIILTQLPWIQLSDTDSWLDENLNCLVRKNHITPIFISFEQFARLNSSEVVQHLIHSSGLSFGLDLNCMTATESLWFMEQAIIQNIFVYPVLSNELSCYRGIEKAMGSFKERIGRAKYVQLCRMMHMAGLLLK